jgi:hypothetical protein
MHHVSIGFLHQGFHPLYRFLNLSNRQECPGQQTGSCAQSECDLPARRTATGPPFPNDLNYQAPAGFRAARRGRPHHYRRIADFRRLIQPLVGISLALAPLALKADRTVFGALSSTACSTSDARNPSAPPEDQGTRAELRFPASMHQSTFCPKQTLSKAILMRH